MQYKVMGWTRTGFMAAYAQNLSVQCDLDLQAGDMILAGDTLSCHDNYLCQIILKSQHVGHSYGPDTNICNYSQHTKFTCGV